LKNFLGRDHKEEGQPLKGKEEEPVLATQRNKSYYGRNVNREFVQSQEDCIILMMM